MHIPDHALTPAISATLTAVSAAAISLALLSRRRHTSAATPASAPLPPRALAPLAAFIFALQMLNFPVAHGTSGHFLGGALAVAALGWTGGLLAMALVLLVQTLLFGDGGLSALGANFFTMGIVAGLAGLLAGRSHWRAALASAAGVLLAAAACSALIVLSGLGSPALVFPSMLQAHLPVAFVEGAITAGLLALARSGRIRQRALTVLALLSAAIVAPFASPFPDGLETTMERAGGLPDAAPFFPGLLPDYTLPPLGETPLSAALAGVIGVAGVLALTKLFAAFGAAPARAK